MRLMFQSMFFTGFADFVSLCPSLCSAQSYWSQWGEWGPCSTTFCNDVGVQVRQRTCVNSQPMPLLLVPACQGHPSERRECSTPPCTGENRHITLISTCNKVKFKDSHILPPGLAHNMDIQDSQNFCE